jgi:hypothetical protein
MDARRLTAFARSVGHPVYWAGSRSGTSYEVSRTRDRSIYVRYLAAGVPAGSSRQFLTVGTYPNPQARAAISQALRQPGARRARGPGREVAVITAGHPHSIYFAADEGRFLVEVFDPDPVRARRVARTIVRIP